jgi:outer membrane receptor for monomeric catechols
MYELVRHPADLPGFDKAEDARWSVADGLTLGAGTDNKGRWHTNCQNVNQWSGSRLSDAYTPRMDVQIGQSSENDVCKAAFACKPS